MLELHVDLKKPADKKNAKLVLKVASEALALLRAIEKDKTGKAPQLPWAIQIAMYHRRASIVFSLPSPAAHDFAEGLKKANEMLRAAAE